ncbi:hypothetical protein ECTW09195_3175, partial [Escherichia coli TW09195]
MPVTRYLCIFIN